MTSKPNIRMALMLATLPFLLSTTAPGDEFAIVTAQTGYLVDEDDDIVEQLIPMSLLDVQKEDGVWLIVKSAAGNEGWIRKEQVHRSSLFDYITADNTPGIRSAMNVVHRAMKLSLNGEPNKAIPVMQKALADLENAFGADNPGYAWLLTYLASMHIDNDENTAAAALLERSERIFASLGQTKHLQAADLYNTRAILANVKGDYKAAISDYQEAMLISSSVLGVNHADIRAVSTNLASLYTDIGDYELAVVNQKRAQQISNTILPPDVDERAADTWFLGVYLQNADRHEEAKAELLEAFRIYSSKTDASPVTLADVQIGLGQSYVALKQSGVAKRQFSEALEQLDLAEKRKEAFDADEIRQLRGRAYNELGVVDSSLNRSEQALAHFLKSLGQYDLKIPDADTAITLTNAGDELVILERYAEAKPLFDQALAMYTKLDGVDSESVRVLKDRLNDLPAMTPENAEPLTHLMVSAPEGYLRNEKGKVVETVPACALLEIVESTSEDYRVKWTDGKTALIRKELVRTGKLMPSFGVMPLESADDVYQLLARYRTMVLDDDYSNATPVLDEALQLIEKNVGRDNAFYAFVDGHMAFTEAQRGLLKSATDRIVKMAPLLNRMDQANDPVMAEFYAISAFLLHLKGNDATAREHLLICGDRLEKQGRRNSAEMLAIQNSLASLDASAGDFAAAFKIQSEIVAVAERIYPRESGEYAEFLAKLGFFTAATGSMEDGVNKMREALQLAKASPSPDRTVPDLQMLLSFVLMRPETLPEAKQLLQAALPKLDKAHSLLGVRKRVAVRVQLSEISAVEDEHKKVVALGEEALRLFDISQQQDNSLKRRLHELLAVSYSRLGERTKAAAHEAAMTELDSKTEDATPGPGENPSMATTPAKRPANASFDASRFELWPDDEFMLITIQQTPIKDGDDVLQTVAAGTRLWSLEVSDGWHKVKVPDQETYGWVHSGNVQALADVLMQQALQNALQKHGNNPEIAQKAAATIRLFENAERLSQLGDFANAVTGFEQALQSSRQVLGEGNAFSAMVNTELVGAYMNAQQFSRARRVLEDTLAVTEEKLGDNHPRLAVEYWRLGSLLGTIGDFSGAERQLSAAVKVASDAFGANEVRTQMLRTERATALIQLGRLDEAKQILAEVIAMQPQESDVPNPLLAECQTGLGLIRFQESQYQAAAEHLERAADELTRMGDEYRGARGRVLYFLGAALVSTGELNEADGLLKAAEEDYRASGQVNQELLGQIQQILAVSRFLQGDVDAAAQSANQSLEILKDIYGGDHILTATQRFQIASVMVAQRRLSDGLQQFDTARRAVFEYANSTLADLPTAQQIAFLRFNDRKNLDRALSVSLQQDVNKAAIDATVSWLLNSKSLTHTLSARTAQIRRLLTVRSHRKAYDNYIAARRQLATLPTGKADAAEQRFRDDERNRLRQLEQTAINQLPTDVQQQIAGQQQKWTTVDDVRSHLKPDETLVEILRMRPQTFDPRELLDQAASKQLPPEVYVAWIIPPQGKGDVQVLSLGLAEKIDGILGRTLSTTQYTAKNITRVGHREATKELRADLEHLAEAVWHPIERLLDGRNKLVLSPDSELWRTPWGALPSKEGRMLVEDFEVRLVNSGRDIVPIARPALALAAPMILADPDYDASEEDVAAALLNGRPSTTDNDAPVEDSDTTQLRASMSVRAKRLAGTATEARAVVNDLRSFADEQPELYLRAAASEATFRRGRRPSSLMFSTHGFFVPGSLEPETADAISLLTEVSAVPAATTIEQDPLLRCGLLLAGCNENANRDAARDGVLVGREIVGTDLRGTRLVVLSACETGVGDVTDGEGVAGLRHAFQLAGAESVVSTLWSIDDKETSELMKEFFAELGRGKSKPAALRQAQLTRIAARTERHGAAHPFYWAAFTLTGQE